MPLLVAERLQIRSLTDGPPPEDTVAPGRWRLNNRLLTTTTDPTNPGQVVGSTCLCGTRSYLYAGIASRGGRSVAGHSGGRPRNSDRLGVRGLSACTY